MRMDSKRKRIVDHDLERCQRYGKWDCPLQRGIQYEHILEIGHGHGRRQIGDCDASGCDVLVYRVANDPLAIVGWVHGDIDGDESQRLRVDGELQCRVDYRHEWRERQRQRLGRIFRRGEYQHRIEKRNVDGGRQNGHCHSGWSDVQLHRGTDVHLADGCCFHGDDCGNRHSGLLVDGIR